MVLWNDKANLWLLTPDEIKQLPAGTILESINGSKKEKESCDLDTRFGYTAFGIRNPMEHELAELFTLMRLKTK